MLHCIRSKWIDQSYHTLSFLSSWADSSGPVAIPVNPPKRVSSQSSIFRIAATRASLCLLRMRTFLLRRWLPSESTGRSHFLRSTHRMTPEQSRGALKLSDILPSLLDHIELMVIVLVFGHKTNLLDHCGSLADIRTMPLGPLPWPNLKNLPHQEAPLVRSDWRQKAGRAEI